MIPRVLLALVAGAGLATLTACSYAPAPTSTVSPAPTSTVSPAATVTPSGAPPIVPIATGRIVHVASVHDGDTFTDTAGVKYRPLVMDSCELGTPGGTRAQTEARQLLDGQDVTVATEPGHEIDHYGRTLAYVTLPDGRDFADTMLEADHTAVYAGRNDASPEKVAEGRAHDANGRTCGTEGTASTQAPAPTSDAPYVPAPRVHTGHSGHPCLPGERDGDHDGFCGEGR